MTTPLNNSHGLSIKFPLDQSGASWIIIQSIRALMILIWSRFDEPITCLHFSASLVTPLATLLSSSNTQKRGRIIYDILLLLSIQKAQHQNSNSNHPFTIIKHLPASIGRRISDMFSSKEHFNKAKPHYESALKQSGHDGKLMYTERKKPVTHTAQNSRKKRQRNIIWFNPPYSMNVQTNIRRQRVPEPRL